VSLFRILLAILALGATYIGYEEARVAWRCPKKESFHTQELRQLALREGPVWAEITSVAMLAPRFAPRTIDYDRYVPMRCDEDRYGTPLVLIVRPAHAEKVVEDEEGYLRAEGLSYLPPPGLEATIRKRLEASGVDVAPGFRVLEVGRSPAPWSAAAALFGGGLILVALTLGGRGRKAKILVNKSEVRAEMAARDADKQTASDTTAADEAARDKKPIAPVPTAATRFAERRRQSKKAERTPRKAPERLEPAPDVPLEDVFTIVSKEEIASILDKVFVWGSELDEAENTDATTDADADAEAELIVDLDVEAEMPEPLLPEPAADAVAVESPQDPERPIVSRSARRTLRFQEFDSILTFARPQASGDATTRLAPSLFDAAPHALEPDADVLAILETCELPQLDELLPPDGHGENRRDVTPINEVRLLSEVPPSRREPAKPA
jgi:hypothetical protein